MKMKVNKILGLIILSMLTTHAMTAEPETNTDCQDATAGDIEAPAIGVEHNFILIGAEDCENLNANQYCLTKYNKNMKKIGNTKKKKKDFKTYDLEGADFVEKTMDHGLYRIESKKNILDGRQCYRLEKISGIEVSDLTNPSSSFKFVTTHDLDTFNLVQGETSDDQHFYLELNSNNEYNTYPLQELENDFYVSGEVKNSALYRNEAKYLNLDRGHYVVKDTGFSSSSPVKNSRLLILERYQDDRDFVEYLTWESTTFEANEIIYLKHVSATNYKMFKKITELGDYYLVENPSNVVVSNKHVSSQYISNGAYRSLSLSGAEFKLQSIASGPITNYLIELQTTGYSRSEEIITLHLTEKIENKYDAREVNVDYSIKDSIVTEMTALTNLGGSALATVLVVDGKFYILNFQNGEMNDHQVYQISPTLNLDISSPKTFHFEKTENEYKLREKLASKEFKNSITVEIKTDDQNVETFTDGLHEITKHSSGQGFYIKHTDGPEEKKFYEYIQFQLNSDTDDLNTPGQYRFTVDGTVSDENAEETYTVQRVYSDGSVESGNSYKIQPVNEQYPGGDVDIPNGVLIVTPDEETPLFFSLAPGSIPTFIEYETLGGATLPADLVDGNYFIKNIDNADRRYEFYHQTTDGELKKIEDISLADSDNGKGISDGLYSVKKESGNQKIHIFEKHSDKKFDSFIGHKVTGLGTVSLETGQAYYVEKKGDEFIVRIQETETTFGPEITSTITKVNTNHVQDPSTFISGIYSFTKIPLIDEADAVHIKLENEGDFLDLIRFKKNSQLTEGSFFITLRNDKYFGRQRETISATDANVGEFTQEFEISIESTGENHKTVPLREGLYEFEEDSEGLKIIEAKEGTLTSFLSSHTISATNLQDGEYNVTPDGTNKYKFALKLPGGRFAKNTIEVTTTDNSDLKEANFEIFIEGTKLHYNHILDSTLNSQRAFQTELPPGDHHLTLVNKNEHEFIARKKTSNTFEAPVKIKITLWQETPTFLTSGVYTVNNHDNVANFKSIIPIPGQDGAFDSGKFGDVEYTIEGLTTTTTVNIWIKNANESDKSKYFLRKEKGSYDFETRAKKSIEKYVGTEKLNKASLEKGLYQVEIGTGGKFKLTLLKKGGFGLFKKPWDHASNFIPPNSAFKFMETGTTTEYSWKTPENGFYYVKTGQIGRILLQKHENSLNVGTAFPIDVTKFNDNEANNIKEGYYKIDKIDGKIWMDLLENGLYLEIHKNTDEKFEIHEVLAMNKRKLIITPSPETLEADVKTKFVKFFINNDENEGYSLYKYDQDTKKVTDRTVVTIKEKIGDTERDIKTVQSGLVNIKERSGTNAGTFQLKHLKTGTTINLENDIFFRVTSSNLEIDETKGAYQIHQKKTSTSPNFSDSVSWVSAPALVQDQAAEFWIKKKNNKQFHLYRVDKTQDESILLRVERIKGTKLEKPDLDDAKISLTLRQDGNYDITVKFYTSVQKKKVENKNILKEYSNGYSDESSGSNKGFSIETFNTASDKFDTKWTLNPSIAPGAEVKYYLKHKNGNIYWLYREDGTQTSATKTKIMKIKGNGDKTTHWHYDGLYKISVRSDKNFKVKAIWWGAIKKKDDKLKEDHYNFYSYFSYDHEEFKMTKLDNSNLNWIKSNHNGNYLVKKLQATNRYRIQKLKDGKVTGDSRVVKIRTMDDFETDFFDGKYKFTKKGDKKFHVEVKWWFDVKQKEVGDKWVLEEVTNGKASTGCKTGILSSFSAKFDIIGRDNYDFQKTADNNGKFLLLKKNPGNKYQMMKKDGTVVVEVVIKKKNGNFKNNFKAGLYKFTLTNDGKYWKIKNVWKRGLELHEGKLETIGTSLKEHRYKIEKKEGGSWKFIKNLNGRFEIKHDSNKIYKIQRIDNNGYLVGNKLTRRIQLIGDRLEKPEFEDGDYKIKTKVEGTFSITFHPRSEIMQKKKPGISNAVTIPGGGSLLQALSISAPQTMGASDSNILCFRANSQAAQSLLTSGAKPIGVEVEVVTPIDASIETDFQHHCETYIVEMRHAHSVAEYDHYLAEYEHYVQEFFHSNPEAHFRYDMPPSCPV